MPHRHRKAVALVEAQHLVEALQLQAGMRQVAGIGIGKVRKDPFDFHMSAFQRRFLEQVRAVIVNADPFHAGVNLQMHFGPDAQLRRDRIDLLQALHRRSGQRQIVLQITQDLVAPDAAQNQDRSRNAQLAQEDALLQDRHADVVCFPGQGFGHLRQPVSVSVGLHDQHHPGGRDPTPDCFQVLFQARQIDFRPRCPHSAIGGNRRRTALHKEHSNRIDSSFVMPDSAPRQKFTDSDASVSPFSFYFHIEATRRCPMRIHRILCTAWMICLTIAGARAEVVAGRWEKIGALAPGTAIIIHLPGGERLEGTFNKIETGEILFTEFNGKERKECRRAQS